MLPNILLFHIRVHNSRDGSGENEAESTNSAIGDSIVDGATIEWEKYEKFDGLNDEELMNITLNEYEENEANRMKKKCLVCHKSNTITHRWSPLL